MRAKRTDLSGFTEEQRRAHFNSKERERWAKNPEAGRARGRRAYAKDPQKKMTRDAVYKAANPESRRAVVRKSRHKNPGHYLLKAAEYRAKRSGVAFSLTEEWARETYTGFCALSGLPFEVGSRRRHGANPYSPSIDRVVPELWYAPSNCRFILYALNQFKSDMAEDTMLLIARAMVAKNAPH